MTAADNVSRSPTASVNEPPSVPDTESTTAAHMTEAREYSVVKFKDDGCHQYEEVLVDVATAKETFDRVKNSLGARVGTIVRIVITDGSNTPCLQWSPGQGTTLPSGEGLPNK